MRTLAALLTACLLSQGASSLVHASQPAPTKLAHNTLGTQAAQARAANQALGRLLIIGGGTLPVSLLRKIIELSGGPQARIVVFPNASEIPEEAAGAVKERLEGQGARNVQIYACKTGAMDQPACLKQLEGARGVFFTGGDQNKLAAAFAGTEAFRRVTSVYQQGGVLSGTSAGAAIMSRIMLTGDERPAPAALEGHAEPAKDPFASIRRQAVVTSEGFGFVTRFIVDQHFVRRMRQNRLIGVVLDHPDLIGVGIDESTGILVYPDQSFEVVGDASVMVIDAREASQVMSNERQHYSARNLRMHLLTAGQIYE